MQAAVIRHPDTVCAVLDPEFGIFTTSFMRVVSLRRLTKSQVAGPSSWGAPGAGVALIGVPVSRNTPRLILDNSSLPPSAWQPLQNCWFCRRTLASTSRSAPGFASTVSTITGEPVASARLIMALVLFQSAS
jgi:hypothetical protein